MNFRAARMFEFHCLNHKLSARRGVWAFVLLAVSATAIAFGSQGAAASPPDVNARAALVVDVDDGKILYEKSANRKLSIASLTKLMTALLVFEQVPLEERITAAPYSPQPAESKIGLRTGESMSVRDLLYGLLLASANDAAITFAQRLSGSTNSFVREMNSRSRQLGLKNTRFANPIGLDDADNFSSANDLARLTRKLMKIRSFRQIVRSPTKTIRSGDRVRKLVNRNRLVAQYKFVNGVKTGRTLKSGFSLIGSGTKKGVNLVTVLLGANSEASRDAGTLALFKYGFSRYRTVKAVRKGRKYGDADVRFRGTKVGLRAARSLSVQARRDQDVRVVSKFPRKVAETKRGKGIGTVKVIVDGETAARTDLVASRTVERAGTVQKAVYYLLKPLSIILLIVVMAIGWILYRVIRHRK